MGRRVNRAAWTASSAIWLLTAASLASGAASNLKVVGQIGGPCRAVDVVGNYAYIGEGQNLTILNVANPAAPAATGRAVMLDGVPGLVSNNVEGVDVSAGRACVVTGWGLHVFDVTNPARPVRLGSSRAVSPTDVCVVGSMAYVSGASWPLQMFDISNPSSPTMRGVYIPQTPMREGYDVCVFNNLAYVAGGDNGLLIIDVSVTSSPWLRGSYNTPGSARGVQVVGNTAYVADRNGGLQIINVTNPAAPTLRASFPTPDQAEGVFVANNLAYVSCWGAGVLVVNVSNPALPTLAGSYNTPGGALDLVVAGGAAYVADLTGLQILNVTVPSYPARFSAYESLYESWGLHVAGTRAYVADGHYGLKIVDVSNPAFPVIRGSHHASTNANDVHVQGNLAYVADGSSGRLMIFDAGNPSSPTLRGSYQTPDYATGVHIYGPDAYVSDEDYGLQIVNVSNPAAPALRGSYNTPGRALDVYTTSGLAYVADAEGGLRILNVGNPAAPTLRGSYATPGNARGIFVSRNLAYLTTYLTSGFLILDVANPAAPRFVGSYPLSSYGDLALSGKLAYVAAGMSGVRVLDVSDPTSPTLKGYFETAYVSCADVAASGGYAYAAYGELGLWVFQYIGSAPRIQSATISDVNRNWTTDRGDQLVLTLDRSVVVTTSALRTSHFFLPVVGDSLGGTGFRVDVNPYNSRQIVLTLGAGTHLTAPGAFSMRNRSLDSPSGIDFSRSLPPGTVVSLDGVSAVDGGTPGADDSGVDVQFSLSGTTNRIGPSGGAVFSAPSVDLAYTGHRFAIPRNALATTTTFSMRPPVRSLGVINAFTVASSRPTVTFTADATVRVQFREGDVDRERGLIEAEMKVHQLVERPLGVFQYLPLSGPQTLNGASRQVSVGVRSLNPRGTLGATGVFAGLPIETVDERTIHVAPGSGVTKGAWPFLSPGPNGAYTLHKIEFPNHVATTAADPNRRTVTIRTATLLDRWSPSCSRAFPEQSGAVFVVTAQNALGQPLAFTAPVNVTVQFKARPDPAYTDAVRFDGRIGLIQNMRMVCNRMAGNAGDFDFMTAPSQTANPAQGTVTANNYAGLTGPEGCRTFGAVAFEGATPADRWQLYR